jgi:16S rRNA (adenine1518-N6/adenine1519-N6)-dimethyltransferase
VTLHSPLASPKATLEKLAQEGINIRKSLGQHFLIDDGVIGRILRLAAPEAGDVVLEVGPGIGTLTEALLRRGAAVIAVEKDERLLPPLSDIQARYPDHLILIHADALDLLAWDRGICDRGICDRGTYNLSRQNVVAYCHSFDVTDYTSPCHICHTPSPCPTRLIANLPYAVAATVVLDCFQRLPTIQSATVMVQKEVAERMAAEPGSKDYGAYTVKLQLLAQPGAHFTVSPTSFLPPPRVSSAVIRFDRRADQPSTAELNACSFVADAAFAERRKTIRNSMRSYFAAHGLDPAQVDALLTAAAIPPTVRGETLPVETFRHLARHFATS